MKDLIFRLLLTVFTVLVISISSSSAQEQEVKLVNDAKEETKSDTGDSWFGMDKLYHFAASAGITGLSYHYYHCQLNNPEKNSIYFSVSLAGAAGIGKEFTDKNFRKTGWSWKDIAVDGVGIVVGYLLFIKLHK